MTEIMKCTKCKRKINMAGVHGVDEITALLDIEEGNFGRWCAVNHMRFRIQEFVRQSVEIAVNQQYRNDKEMVRNGKDLK